MPEDLLYPNVYFKGGVKEIFVQINEYPSFDPDVGRDFSWHTVQDSNVSRRRCGQSIRNINKGSLYS